MFPKPRVISPSLSSSKTRFYVLYEPWLVFTRQGSSNSLALAKNLTKIKKLADYERRLIPPPLAPSNAKVNLLM